MPADHKQKDPTVAGVLALVTGPLGFLYLGWRYGLAATVAEPVNDNGTLYGIN